VNGPEIDWPFAEMVLERFLFLWNEEKAIADSEFRQAVWYGNNFDSNIVILLRGGDCWRVRKSLELIQKIVEGAHNITVYGDFFDSLASILLQPIRSSKEDEERKLVYLIATNQDRSLDFGVSRLIHSFLYSRKGKTDIAFSILKIISAFVCQEDSDGTNEDNLETAADITNALIKTLIEEKNADVIWMSLELLSTKYDDDSYHSIFDPFIERGICEVLMCIMKTYPSDRNKIFLVIETIVYIIEKDSVHIDTFVSLGILNSLVKVFNKSPDQYECLRVIVDLVCTYNRNYISSFCALGVPRDSKFFEYVNSDSDSDSDDDGDGGDDNDDGSGGAFDNDAFDDDSDDDDSDDDDDEDIDFSDTCMASIPGVTRM
jgi:hypothetical protein